MMNKLNYQILKKNNYNQKFKPANIKLQNIIMTDGLQKN